MPDLQNFAVTRGANANLTVPTWTIAGEIRDSQTGALLRTFSVRVAIDQAAANGDALPAWETLAGVFAAEPAGGG